MLTGEQIGKLRDALNDAFPGFQKQEQLARLKLDCNLYSVAGSGPGDDVMYRFVEWAMARGRIWDLVDGARSLNPGNPLLRIFSEETADLRLRGIAGVFVGSTVQLNSSDSVTKAQERLRRVEMTVVALSIATTIIGPIVIAFVARETAERLALGLSVAIVATALVTVYASVLKRRLRHHFNALVGAEATNAIAAVMVSWRESVSAVGVVTMIKGVIGYIAIGLVGSISIGYLSSFLVARRTTENAGATTPIASSTLSAHVEKPVETDSAEIPTANQGPSVPVFDSNAARPSNTATSPKVPSPIVLSPDIPGDVTGSGSTLGAQQANYDVLSWNTFIALTWPVGPDGVVDPRARPGENGDNPTVWQGFREASSIFLPGGKTPTWSGPPDIPPVCKAAFKPGMRILRQTGKTVLSEAIQPFDTGPLIDQHGAFARFEISTNKTMFDYILGNALYSKAGQKAFTGPAKFPCGSATIKGAEGAIVIKAAWKMLSDPSEKARFHTSDVLVYTPASTNPKVPESCAPATVALVGLHIGHKTVSAAQWIWATFEHVDNDPTEADVKSGNLKASYTYYNPACKDCPVNKAAPRPWDPTKPNANHTQVVRLDPFSPAEAAIPASAKARNADAQKLLASVNAKSVWQYYELISTQRPTSTGANCTANPANPFGTPAPTFLANTTLETFVQGQVPLASSSCIACHGNAAMTTGATADFTYVLQRAQ